jgi:hypothetical protein
MYIGMMIASGVSTLLLTNNYSFLSIGVFCALASILVLPIISYLVKEHIDANKEATAKVKG